MAEQVDIPELERIVFFSGQLLEAADLTDLERGHRELRWLHNRTLHGWGIGAGFEVSARRGEREVNVAPGYAVDSAGREIILTERRLKTVPAVAGASGEVLYYLTAAYQGDKGQKIRERRPGVCSPEGTVRLSEDPVIDWRRPKDVKQGIDIVLASVWIRNCQLSRDASARGRRYARPAHRPYIAAGQTISQATEWEPWQEGNQFLGFSVQVETSAARFSTTPHYLAHIQGERFLQAGQIIAFGIPAVVMPTADRFELRVLLPAGPDGSHINPPALRHPVQGLAIIQQLGWSVIWMGMEA